MDALDFSDFTPTQFEEFCFELLRGLPGVHNVDWRKGTPKPASPADRGRDITAEVDHIEIDGARSEMTVEMEKDQYDLKEYRIPLESRHERGWGKVTIPADVNPADNDYYFAFERPAPRRAVIVADDIFKAEAKIELFAKGLILKK